MTRRLATMCSMMVLLIGVSSPCVRGATDSDRASLKGIAAVYVLLENLPDSAKMVGLSSDTIQNDVELKLRLAGIRVVTTPEEGMKLPGAPVLYVQVGLTGPAVAACIAVKLRQSALLERNHELVFGATTWETESVMARPTAQAIRDQIKDSVDAFLNDWLSVNPKK